MRGTSGKTCEGLLSAAAELFYRDGIRNVSVDAVAERAGVTKKTLYYHFKSKDELIAAYLEARNDPVLARLKAAATKVRGSSLADQIAGLFKALGRAAKKAEWKGCPFARAVAELAGSTHHPANEVAARHKIEFESWLRMRAKEENLRGSATVARQIMVLLDGAITEMMIHRDPIYAQAAGKAAVLLVRQARSS